MYFNQAGTTASEAVHLAKLVIFIYGEESLVRGIGQMNEWKLMALTQQRSFWVHMQRYV